MTADNNVSDKLVIAVAFFSFISMGLFAGLVGVAWPSMRLEFGVPLDAIGVVMVLSMVVSLAITFSSGRLIASLGLGAILVIGAVIAALGFLGNALAPAWWMMVLMAVVASAGSTIINTGLNIYFAIASTASIMNWLHASFGLGATISPLILVAVLNSGRSWRWGYALVALVFAMLALFYFLTRKRWIWTQSNTEEKDVEPVERAGYKDSLRMVAVWLSLLLFFTFTGMESTSGQWPYVLFTEGRGVDPVMAGLWVSIFWASMTAGRFFFGFLVRYVPSVPMIRACSIAVIIGAGLVWLNPATTLSFLGLVMIGFFVAPFFPVLASETPNRLGMAHAANVLGFQITAVRLGIAVAPALVGVWAEAMGLEMIALALFLIAIAIAILFEATIRWPVSSEDGR